MKAFVIALMTCSAALSVVILLYIIITPLLSKYYSAKGLYYSWLIIVIGLIIPFRPQLNTTIINIMVKTPAKGVLANSLPTISTLPVNTVTQIDNAIFSSALPGIQWWKFIAAIWLIGVIIFLFIHRIKHYRFIKMANRWNEDITDERILMLMQNIKKDLRVSKRISLSLCPYISSPMMVGLFNPRILLPVADFSQEELYFILKHELVHYKRKDLYYKYLLLIATAMHWFNPIVYLMVKAVNIQCELSCDAEVVRSTNMNMRYQYCKTILELLRVQSKMKTALSINFYGGKNGMKNRISSIMDTRKKKVGLSVILATLIITIGVGIANVSANPNSTLNGSISNIKSDVIIKLRDPHNIPENYSTSVSYVDSRPELEFYIEGKSIAQIELTCQNEYIYAVDWTKTQHEKYWNIDYFQTYDEKTQTSTFYPERLYDKSMKLVFDEGFSGYGDIWYRWTAWNLYQWAAEDNFSHFIGYGISPKIELSGDIPEEQKLKLAAGDNGSGITNLGHIQLDGYPEELTKDRITIKITDRDGNTITKYINIEINNNEFYQTVVNASLDN